MSKLPANKSDEIRSWLNSIDINEDAELSDIEATCPSVVESSIIESSSSSDSGDEVALGQSSHNHIKEYNNNLLPQIPALSFNNVNICNSSNVYLGNIYSVNGTLNINVINGEEKPQEDQESAAKKSPVIRPACLIFPRYRWLAMDPLSESNKLPEPVEFISIGYTATTSSTVQARNIGIIRDYQTLNVEAQGFNDIIYNFLIGCDGTIYEGRGWGVEGDHTAGYNHKSIGVAIIGNFKQELPPERTFKACQKLITRGIDEGHLSKDYKIFAPPTANYNLLNEELKKWDHFWDIQNCNES
ncbi:peptidoglycan-recognition protein LE-like [Lucilia sericata]|uniref:peptidoglycan-recognition protein LE-like n=1 Tax=Lucilia sericata TaxID=13632 RepID=UPI0018A84C28|nr:peptidoglycan-recognition protein LE-like [Lucilia sericata]